MQYVCIAYFLISMDMEQQGQAASSTTLWRWSPACAPVASPSCDSVPEVPHMIGDSVTAQPGHGGGYLATTLGSS